MPTSDVLWRLIGDSGNLLETDDAAIQFASRTCSKASVFHWPLEFPLVFANGGFDCVLGNPPWEKAKVEDAKWFENRYPEVANAKTGAIPLSVKITFATLSVLHGVVKHAIFAGVYR